jgi:hypothetical protein
MQRAAIVKIREDGVATLGRDGGGSAGQEGRLEVRPGGGVVWCPLVPGQETAEVPAAVQGLAPGEVPQMPPPAAGHAAGVASEPQSPPVTATKDAGTAVPDGTISGGPPAQPIAPPVPPADPAGPAAPGVTPPGPDPQPAV